MSELRCSVWLLGRCYEDARVFKILVLQGVSMWVILVARVLSGCLLTPRYMNPVQVSFQ